MVDGTRLDYWVIEGRQLRALLERAQAGEDVGMLLAEVYANSDTEQVDPPTEDPS